MQLPSGEAIGQIRIIIRGAGEQASGIAHCLFRSGLRVCLLEIATPLAVRRMVSYSEAVYDGEKTVEGVTTVRIAHPAEIFPVWTDAKIPLLIDPDNRLRHFLKPHVLIDAILAKRNLGTRITDAPLVIGLGPGFSAPKDVHIVIESNRGHHLGRLIFEGEAQANTGNPGKICGYSSERVLRAPREGVFRIIKNIGDMTEKGETVAKVGDTLLSAGISGIIRGILRDGTPVKKGLKAGDIDPRANPEFCSTISDKARALGGAALAAILYGLKAKIER